ncbi:MAG: DNA-primase RepB domain-containing protein [Magnetococcus sp. YQC-5]
MDAQNESRRAATTDDLNQWVQDYNTTSVQQLQEAQAFLFAMAGDEQLTFQTFDDSSAKRSGLVRVLHGNFDRHADTLANLNQQGAGIFVTVNSADGKGRKAENITRIRAVFLDLDGAPLPNDFPLQPSILVESSPGKYHVYWLLANVLPLAEFKPLQQALAARYGGDQAVCDLPRVMRLPGFIHRKAVPCQSRLMGADPALRYTAQQIQDAFLPAVIQPMCGAATDSRDEPPPAPHLGGLQPYVRAAMDGECSRVSTAQIGNRNNALNLAAVKLGNFVASGNLPAEFAEAALMRAASVAGLTQAEAVATIRSGLKAGQHKPRQTPAQRGVDVFGGAPGMQCHSREELSDRINNSDDFDELTGPILQDVVTSGLPEPSVEVLLKSIAKQARIPVSSLRKSIRAIHQRDGGSHLDAARQILDAIGGQEDVIHHASAFWTWRGSVWKRIEDREVQQAIHQYFDGRGLTKSLADSVLDLIRTESFRPGHQFDTGGEFVNCSNGELHFEDGQWVLKPHCRENYRTSQIPVAYDPVAKPERFFRFLVEVFKGDPDATQKLTVVLIGMVRPSQTASKCAKMEAATTI